MTQDATPQASHTPQSAAVLEAEASPPPPPVAAPAYVHNVKPLYQPISFQTPLDGPIVVLDLETTGLDYRTEGIVEIGAVKLDNGQVVDTFHTLVNPQQPIRSSSHRIHAISEEMVQDAPTIQEVLPPLLAFLGDLPFVAHNAIFDFSFLNQAMKKHLDRRLTNHRIDSQELFRVVFPEEVSHGLSALLERFGFDPHVNHRALDDAMALALVFPRLRQLYEQHIAWAASQLPNMPFLLERFVRLQKASQALHAEMSELKELFKIYFQEGGSMLTAATGETLSVNRKRQFDYDEKAMVEAFRHSPLLADIVKPNLRVVERWLTSGSSPFSDEEKALIHSLKTQLTESWAVQISRAPSPKVTAPEATGAEDPAPAAGVTPEPSSPQPASPSPQPTPEEPPVAE